MQQRERNVKLFVMALIVSTSFFFSLNAESAPPQNLEARVSALESAVAALQAQVASQQTQIADLESDLAAVQSNNALALDPYVSVQAGELNGLTGPHILFTGANVHVQSGSGTTWDGESLTGLGNLVVGYNELRDPPPSVRNGSHNLIVGSGHNYSSYAGLIAGGQNEISAPFAFCVGARNIASGFGSSVSGGVDNIASGETACVSGGSGRSATGDLNWAAGSLFEAN